MRLSLKWLFVLVTYVAIAAAACTQSTPGWRALLWVVNLYFVLYAVLLAIHYREKTQAIALGFVLFAAAASMVVFTTSRSPVAQQWIRAMAPSKFVSPQEYDKMLERVERLHWETVVAQGSADPTYKARIEAEHRAATRRLQGMISAESFIASLNPVLVPLVGLVGSAVSWRMWKRAQVSEQCVARASS